MSFTTPYYLITSCCPQATMSGFFHISALGTVPNGTYQYTGPSYTEPGGMIFDQNFCYTITYQGSNNAAFNSAFSQTEIDLLTDCDHPLCAPCGSKSAAFSVFNCCDTTNVVNLNIDPATCIISDGVWIYTGPGYTQPLSGFIFTPGDCYTVTELPDGTYEVGPDCTDFTISSYATCQAAAADGACPACALGLEFLIFTSCCDASVILFQGSSPSMAYYGVNVYNGLLVNGLQNTCYSIDIGVVGDALVPDITAYSLLPVPPNITFFIQLDGYGLDCTSSFAVNECPSCIKQCYTLYDCDGNFFNTEIDLSGNLNDFITIIQGGVPSGPWYVLENNSGTCNDAVTGFTVSPIAPLPCDCICYAVIATAKSCIYVDCDGNLVTINTLVGGLIQFCSLVYPFIQGHVFGTPINITGPGICGSPECNPCYILEDCEGILPDIYTTNVSLGSSAIVGQFVILLEYPGVCWEVVNTTICDCAISVTVTQSYGSCADCLGSTNYKLTNCDEPGTIIYTSSDLSAYVGQVITNLDCDGCWIVEEIDLIPSDVPITVDNSYIDCIECGRTYYLLQDCSGYLPDAITYTDLSAYVGDVIKLEYCPETCWEVSITLSPLNAGEVIFIDQGYADCDACLDTLNCICTTVRNDDTTVVSHEYRYLDCDYNVQNFTLLSGETSPKFCKVAWQYNHPDTDYVETFGDCALDSQVWICPAPIYPRRSVQPGYNTPACTIDRYEKISCKSSEIYYQQVLRLRYGISNCCPDETNKWLIKKELIDMDAMRDPDYICTVANSCCTNKSSCNCDSCNCNQSITTCNSQ